MRLGGLLVIFTLLMAIPATARADGFQQSVYLAKSPGFVLITTEIGSSPCAFASGRFLEDAKRALVAGDVKFIEFDKLGVGRPKWPTLAITAQAAEAATSGCVWSLDIVVKADPTDATLFGEPYKRPVEFWTVRTFGTSPGETMTLYVSDLVKSHVAELVEDRRAARTRFAQ